MADKTHDLAALSLQLKALILNGAGGFSPMFVDASEDSSRFRAAAESIERLVCFDVQQVRQDSDPGVADPTLSTQALASLESLFTPSGSAKSALVSDYNSRRSHARGESCNTEAQTMMSLSCRLSTCKSLLAKMGAE